MTLKNAEIISQASLVRERANALIMRALEEHGLTDLIPAHGSVMQALFEHGELCMGELAQVTGRKKNTLTSLVQNLEKNGYLERLPDPLDARMQRVRLTYKGTSVRLALRDISEALLARTWQGVAPKDQEQCLDTLKKVASNLFDPE